MNLSHLYRIIGSALVLAMCGPAAAGPGAHGPNGEHLESPKQATSGVAESPRLDAKSELFELVAHLSGGELSLLIDRFATNDPVLKAAVEVESGTLKAKATFHADIGDYVVDDPAMLKLLTAPGEHALVITVIAGEESDLLDGVLKVGARSAEDIQAHEHGSGGGAWPLWAAGAAIALSLSLFLTWRWRWRNSTRRDAVSRKRNGGQA